MNNEDLYVYKKSDFYEDYISSQNEYYEREQVDTLLAEKDREIALLKERICNGDVSRLTWIDDCIAKDKEIAELKAKLENVQASMYCDVVDANMKNVKLKEKLDSMTQQFSKYVVDANNRERKIHRAFYKACANWAKVSVAFHSSYATKDKWRKMELRCLKKVEEYDGLVKW